VALFEQLHTETRARGLDFLVIGGLAVNFYGYSRDTADLDLLIRRESRAEWGQLLSSRVHSTTLPPFRPMHSASIVREF
jgi:hypothetical protein